MRRKPQLPPPNAVSLSQAKELVRGLAPEQSVLLLAPPGVGKSDLVAQAAGLEVRSLLGTQIARRTCPAFRFALLVDQVPKWADLGATDAMLAALRDVTGV